MSRSRTIVVVVSMIFAALVALSATVTAADKASEAERDSDPSAWDQVTQVGMVHTFFDPVFNDLDAEAAATLVGEGAVIGTPLGTFTGPDGLIEFLSILHRANPDAEFTLDEVSISDAGMAIEWTMTASSYVSDPNEAAAALSVQRSGSATIGFDGYTVADASFAYETAISPLPSDAVAVYPHQETPHQAAY